VQADLRRPMRAASSIVTGAARAASDMEPNQVLSAAPRRPTLSVIVPVYNERATIREILRRVACRPEVDELIIVDDCSTDGTTEVLRDEQAAGWPALRAPNRPLPRIKLFHHEVNQGKGAALRTGFKHATCDVFLTQDAD